MVLVALLSIRSGDGGSAAPILSPRLRWRNRRRVRRRASGRSNSNGFRDFDPAVGRYIQSDPIGLTGGSYSTYAYVGAQPLSFIDSLGLSEQDVNNAWAWLQQHYPALTKDVSFGSSSLLNKTVDGIYVPGTNHFYIAKFYYTDCLSAQKLWDLRNLITHESLHIYLSNKIGTLNYLWNNSKCGYHDWVRDAANRITDYQTSGVYNSPGPPVTQVSAPAPSIDDYPTKQKSN
jgi:RHS repeat-associated protein